MGLSSLVPRFGSRGRSLALGEPRESLSECPEAVAWDSWDDARAHRTLFRSRDSQTVSGEVSLLSLFRAQLNRA